MALCDCNRNSAQRTHECEYWYCSCNDAGIVRAVQQAKNKAIELTQITASLCPLVLDFDPSERPHGRAINDEAIRMIAKRAQDVVILAVRWSRYDWRRIAGTIRRLHESGVGKSFVAGADTDSGRRSATCPVAGGDG